MSKKVKVALTSLIVLVWGLIWYYFLPAFNLRSPGFWCFLIITLLFANVLVNYIFVDRWERSEKQEKVVKVSFIVIVGTIALFLIAGLISIRPFNAHKAQEVANVTVSESEITEIFPDLTTEGTNTMPLVDLDTARVLGDKKIAQLQHASWYDVNDEYNLIKYQDKYYRISVVDYGGLFKYFKANDSGTPGYVLVDVTPKNGVATQEAKLVETDSIFYTPGAFFQKDLRRHLRFQYPTKILSSFSYLEIDEDGKPFWVTGTLLPKAGVFGVTEVKSFIITDANTGESHEYAPEELPEWVDHAYSLEYLMTIAHWHYAYGDGFWNNIFSKTGVLRTSYYYKDGSGRQNDKDSVAGEFANFHGYSSTVGRNGKVYFYTGLTTANNAESNIGWLMINTSTGEMTQYSVIGAEESSAQAAVEQLVQDLGYEATFPLPTNIAGQPSYVMCLKGKAGLAQGYAICNVENYSIAVQADTLDKAIALYLNKLGNPTSVPTETKEEITKNATIDAIHTAEIDGTTHYYYVIDGDLYRASILVNQEQVLFEVGDSIAVICYDNGGIFEITEIQRIE